MTRTALIHEFLERYIREYDYYCEAARICYQICEERLDKSGIRAIVTHRGKSPKSLEKKLKARDTRKGYLEVSDIYDDIVDFSGVRVAIYFPDSIDEIDEMFHHIFDVAKVVHFPKEAEPNRPRLYTKRFPGYVGRHYHVRLVQELLTKEQQRFAQARIEIQVASVMMHAWAEVEHDLVYKPTAGDLSIEELAILDQINGIALQGEEALRALYRAGDARLSEPNSLIKNKYELSALIQTFAKRLPQSERWDKGEMESLADFLIEAGINTHKELEHYLQYLHQSPKGGPIVDRLLEAIKSDQSQQGRAYPPSERHPEGREADEG